MATANDIITRARQRLGIDASEEPLAAVEQQDGFTALREMLAAWTLDGVIKAFAATSFTSVVTVTLADDTVLATELTAEGISANLALRISDYYAVATTQKTVIDAMMGKDLITRKNFLALEKSLVYSPAETAITNMPSQRNYVV